MTNRKPEQTEKDKAAASIVQHVEDLTDFVENYPDYHLYHMTFAFAEVGELLANCHTMNGENGREEIDKAIRIVREGLDEKRGVN